MGSQEKAKGKRKRTRNTTTDQYEMFLNVLENDNVFRTGIINPTVEDNYINNKWLELTEMLNSSPIGPHMSAEEWKKRFSDWKYGVRAKARRIIEHQNKTGSGPQTEIKLTPVEDKALSLWGKVVVIGTPFIDGYDGLPSATNQLPDNFGINENISVECTPEVLGEISNIPQTLQELTSMYESGPSYSKNKSESESLPLPKQTILRKPVARVRHRPKPLSTLAEKLINITTTTENNQETLNNILNNFFKDYLKNQEEELNLEQKKLKFEIAKYKFENPKFDFED